MDLRPGYLVFGSDSWRGHVKPSDYSPANPPEQVAIELEDGRIVQVPGSMLRLQPDGSLRASLAFSELDAALLGRGEESLTIPVVHETLRIGREEVTRGGVRVSKQVHEREEVVDQPLWEEEVSVERMRINRTVDGPVPVREEGDTLVIPILEEVLVVEKRLILREEVRITRRRTEVRKPQTVVLRNEEVTVEQLPDESARP